MLTDHHSHILPGIDDGSKNVKMSLEMIRTLKEQGVERIVATPHFYAHREDGIDAYLQKRQNAFDALMQQNPAVSNIILGAEVAIERGISELDGIQKLAFQGTDYILLEFPYTSFANWMIEEIENITYNFKLTPIIAHLHRYTDDYSKEQMQSVLALNALIQFNNEVFETWSCKRFLKSVISSGHEILFGSDTHNMKSRKPNFDLLLKKAKPEWIERSNSVLDKPNVHI
ncbi:MAG: capsular polysaccharide biosynthesis protein [Ruminococcus sp.]|nr:capsular polysaccharide biosynthesis protein [Ruminococcus sp.]